MKKEIYLTYMPEFHAFGITDDIIARFNREKTIPIIRLRAEDYKFMNIDKPASNAPDVAFLLGREKAAYTIDIPYAKAIAQSGANLRFLTYNENLQQLDGADGLILPGGSFDSPEEFYAEHSAEASVPEKRSYAYITSIMHAEKEQMPILGICAGAQMIGGMHKMKLVHRLGKYTDMEHKNRDSQAHIVHIDKNSPLYNIVQQESIITNSRHREGMLNFDAASDLKIYACTRDGTPEAWGNEEKNILCIQWHPEDFAAAGNKSMQNIYNWLTDKAREYHQQKSKAGIMLKLPKINFQSY